MGIGISFNSRNIFSLIVFKLKRIDYTIEVLFGMRNIPFLQTSSYVFLSDIIGSPELAYILQEDSLCLRNSCHNTNSYHRCQFYREVAFFSSLRKYLDRFDEIFIDLLDCRFMHLVQAFDHIIGDSMNPFPLEDLNVLHKCLKGLPRSEDRACCLIDHEVGECAAHALVSQAHSPQSIVDEEVARHNSIYEELFH